MSHQIPTHLLQQAASRRPRASEYLQNYTPEQILAKHRAGDLDELMKPGVTEDRAELDTEEYFAQRARERAKKQVEKERAAERQRHIDNALGLGSPELQQLIRQNLNLEQGESR